MVDPSYLGLGKVEKQNDLREDCSPLVGQTRGRNTACGLVLQEKVSDSEN